MIVRKIAAWIPMSTEMWEDAQWWRWVFNGTCGDRELDARFAAEDAEYRLPFEAWATEGGAL